MKNKKKNKFTKGKTLGIVAASLATVALVGVGYSAWVIGVQNTTKDNDITVEVDTSSDASVDFTATLKADDNTFSLKEVNTPVGDTEDGKKHKDDFVKVTEGLDAEDMSVTMEYSIDVADGNTIQYNQINVSILSADKAGDGFVDNMIVAGSNKLGNDYRTTGDYYNYFVLVTTSITVNMDKPNVSVPKTEATITFNWGDFFGSMAPTEFYNGLTTRDLKPLEKNKANAALIDGELDAMYGKYHDASKNSFNKIKLHAELVHVSA